MKLQCESAKRLRCRLMLAGLLLILPAGRAPAQLSGNYASATSAANYLAGPGVTLSGASFSGNSRQLGIFGNGQSYIGFDEGILLATGDAAFATTGNTSNHGDAIVLGPPLITSDPDLGQLQGNLKGVAVLEFDFVTTGTTAEFQFVFASEEYLDYVGTAFNDVFGLFISGPGISGPFSSNGRNIALVPTTTTYISINTINDVANSAYFNYNWGSGYWGPAHFAYNGYTTVITASCPVQCGQTYHLRIAISNVQDQNRDSAVMLKRGSLKSNFDLGPISANVQPICEGQNLQLSVQGDSSWTYTWSTGQSGAGLTSITTAASLNTTHYSVTAVNGSGCSITRNIDVEVHPRNNVPPYVNGIDNTGEYTAYVEAGDSICFEIPSFDNPHEDVSITWSGGIGGAAFQAVPGNAISRHQKGVFCWTTQRSDIGIHTFTVTVTDENVCGPRSRSFTFTVKVACCALTIYYENRAPGAYPLPAETVAAKNIVAGESVDPSQTDGPVNTGNAAVTFRAPVITLKPGFTAGPGFHAVADPATCIQECDECCLTWNGFTFNFIPNVFTPNGDGVNDFWYLPDTAHPFCAFNAQGFELEIFNRWGVRVRADSANGAACCPFEAPSPGHPIAHSSIYWDGSVNGGPPASEGTYYYMLTLKACGTQQSFAGFLSLFR